MFHQIIHQQMENVDGFCWFDDFFRQVWGINFIKSTNNQQIVIKCLSKSQVPQFCGTNDSHHLHKEGGNTQQLRSRLDRDLAMLCGCTKLRRGWSNNSNTLQNGREKVQISTKGLGTPNMCVYSLYIYICVCVYIYISVCAHHIFNGTDACGRYQMCKVEMVKFTGSQSGRTLYSNVSPSSQDQRLSGWCPYERETYHYLKWHHLYTMIQS